MERSDFAHRNARERVGQYSRSFCRITLKRSEGRVATLDITERTAHKTRTDVSAKKVEAISGFRPSIQRRTSTLILSEEAVVGVLMGRSRGVIVGQRINITSVIRVFTFAGSRLK